MRQMVGAVIVAVCVGRVVLVFAVVVIVNSRVSRRVRVAGFNVVRKVVGKGTLTNVWTNLKNGKSSQKC